jgi:HSP20 family protein
MSNAIETQRAKKETPQRQEYVLPAVNIREEDGAYILEADMPGVGKDDVEILLEGSELTLVGHRRPATQTGDVLMREQQGADFRRVFEVDPAIDAANISAIMNQGVLRLTLPKSERVKPRKIKVG